MIWPMYAALLAILFLVLSIRIILLRRNLGIALGHGSDPKMLRAMRVHANFAEYVPLCLLLIAGSELMHAPAILVHGLGVTLVVGRVLHAYGVSRAREIMMLRVVGMVSTFTVYLVAVAYLLWASLPA